MITEVVNYTDCFLYIVIGCTKLVDSFGPTRILAVKPHFVPSLMNFNRLNGFPVFQHSCEVKVDDAHRAIFGIAKLQGALNRKASRNRGVVV
nr:hypothetical protein [Tanacetum cinerariifolium]